jgi:hypothetical protein
MRIFGTIIFFILFYCTCTYGQVKDSIKPLSLKEVNISSDKMIAPLSVLDLLINGDKYGSTIIKVEGYIIQEFEQCAIYFSKEGLDMKMSSQAIWINSKDSKVEAIHIYNNKLVILYGKYKAGPSGHLGAYRGEIYDIEQIIEEKQQ